MHALRQAVDTRDWLGLGLWFMLWLGMVRIVVRVGVRVIAVVGLWLWSGLKL